MSTKKQLDIEEFVEFGYLQEANRRYFHPLGLELEAKKLTSYDIVTKLPKGEVVEFSLWDRRNSTKVLLRKVDPEKANRVASEMKARRVIRVALPECNSSGFQKVPRG